MPTRPLGGAPGKTSDSGSRRNGASRSVTRGDALDPDWSQRPIVKELATKLAWAIGSTLHTTYKEKSKTHKWAEELALRIYLSYHNKG